MLLAADITYADYWLKEEIQGFLPNTTIADGFKVYESLLNQFYDKMTPITSQKPYMVGPGGIMKLIVRGPARVRAPEEV